MSLTPETRIGLLSWDYGRPKGGMGRAMQRVMTALRQVKFDVTVLAPCPAEPSQRSLLSFTQHVGGHFLFSLLLPFILNRRIRKEQVTLLLPSLGPGGVFLLRRLPVPVVAVVHHTYVQQYQSVPGQYWKRIFCLFERRTLSFCRHIVCYSDDTKRALTDGYGIDPSMITVLPFPVALPDISSVPRDPHLCVCVARLEERKGVDVLLRAWPSVIRRIPDARLVIVGDGVQRTIIDRMIAATTGVERRSSISQEEMQDLLARSSIAFCPAYLEGFGCACAEAMAAGCCVIASDVDGLRQLITQGMNGVLVPAGDTDAFAAAAIGVLIDSTLAQKVGMYAREDMKNKYDPVVADAALCDVLRAESAAR